MPNIKSAKKRVLVTRTKTERNKAQKSALRTSLKKAVSAIEGGDTSAAAVKLAVKSIDKAAAKGIMHKNTAARRKSALARRVNAAG